MSSDMVRITGINSGLDTEAIITAYTSKAKKRVTDSKNSLTLNKWTQTAWQEINSKIYNFYSKTLSTNRLSSAYKKTKTTTSNDALSVVGGDKATNGVQTAKIVDTAKAAYLTGSKVNLSSGSDNLNSALGIAEGERITLEKNDGTTTTIQIGGSSDEEGVKVVNTMDELAKELSGAGVNANYDATNKRLFIGAKTTGVDNDFKFTGSSDALDKLGLGSSASKVDGSNAKLILNGAEFESNTNTFQINGSTYTINHMPANKEEEISITTGTDYDGIYDNVKGILKEYNELVKEISKLYNAESSKGYKPLTDEQKEEMTDKEIEDWENKIKGALLKNNSTLNDVMNTLSNAMSGGLQVGGKTMYLSDFGISTLGYFSAAENERYALHIDGDADDEATAGNEDKLKAMIASDPESVSSFFSQLCQNLYKDLYAKMGTSSLSSVYKVYNDKELASEQKDWEKKITEYEDKLTAMEDKYYQKFAVMEKTLSKLNSTSTSVSSYLGM